MTGIDLSSGPTLREALAAAVGDTLTFCLDDRTAPVRLSVVLALANTFVEDCLGQAPTLPAEEVIYECHIVPEERSHWPTSAPNLVSLRVLMKWPDRYAQLGLPTMRYQVPTGNLPGFGRLCRTPGCDEAPVGNRRQTAHCLTHLMLMVSRRPSSMGGRDGKPVAPPAVLEVEAGRYEAKGRTLREYATALKHLTPPGFEA